jgi:hypothetical protein
MEGSGLGVEVEYGHNIETDTLGRNESLPRSGFSLALRTQESVLGVQYGSD